jgi:hypothetical protein
LYRPFVPRFFTCFWCWPMRGVARVLHCNVTAHPTPEWTGQQLREAFPFDQLRRYLLRNRDAIFGDDFRREVTGMGIHEVLSTPRSPRAAGICRVRDWFDSTRVPGSCDRVPRKLATSYPSFVFGLSITDRERISPWERDSPEPRAIQRRRHIRLLIGPKN